MNRTKGFLDIAVVAVGVCLLIGLFIGCVVAETAGTGQFWVDHSPRIFVALAGLVLASLPLARRLVCDPHGVPELTDLAAAVRRLGHQHRVYSLNRTLAHLPEERWRKVFATEQEIWRWLGEAYQDGALRAQMRPEVASRVERAGRAAGLLTSSPA